MKINRVYRRGRRLPWGIEYYLRESPGQRLRRVRKFFESEPARDDYALALGEQARQEGLAALQLTAEEAAAWRRLKTWCAERRQDPVEAVQRFLTQAGIVEKSAALETAVAAFLADKRMQGVNDVYLHRLQHYLKTFTAAFAGREIGTITPEELRAWLTDLGFQTETIINYRKYLAALFEFCLKQGWIGRNPVKLVARPKLIRPEPEFYTLEEMRKLFAANEKTDPEICGLFALGAFAGLRSSTVVKMGMAQIDFKNRSILLPAGMMKGRRRHLLEGLPGNLWAWLKRTPAAAFMMGQRHFYWRREEAFRRAGVKPRKNGFRHSFATYYCAWKGEAATAATILAQRDPRMVWEHYKGAAPKQAGAAYFEIRPFASSPIRKKPPP